MRVPHGGGRVRITEGGQQRHGLRGPEAQIEQGDLAAGEPAQLLPRRRVQPGAHRVKLLGDHLALEAQTLGGSTGPTAGGFTDASVVLVDAVRDGGEVVALTVQLDLAEAQHRRSSHGPTTCRVADRRVRP